MGCALFELRSARTVMAVDDLAADQSQRCQPRTVAMLPPTLAERPFFQRPEGISPFRSRFAGLSVATARSAESGEEVRPAATPCRTIPVISSSISAHTSNEAH